MNALAGGIMAAIWQPFGCRRRVLIGAIFLVAAWLGAPYLVFGQESTQEKPRIRRSEAKPIIMQQVEEMSKAAKKNLGYEFTSEEKAKMIEVILQDMETQGTYVFWDP